MNAYWLGISLCEAAKLALRLLVFFFYAIASNWVFDHIFDLPSLRKNRGYNGPNTV